MVDLRRSLPFFAACLLPALATAPLCAQWRDGDLLVRVVDSAGGCVYRTVDPRTGVCTTVLSGGRASGYSGSTIYDSFRDAVLTNVSLVPDAPSNGRLWRLPANGAPTAIASLGIVSLRALCSAGDGRVFYQLYGSGNGEIRWLDAADQPHVLLDAAGTAPFSFAVERLLYHAASNVLIGTTSGWWSPHDCQAGSCSVFRVPLSADGSRVGGPVTCVPLATDNQEIMSLDIMPGGHVLLAMASGTSPVYPYLLRTVDPTTLAIGSYAAPSIGNVDGAVYNLRLGAAVVLDDGTNTLRVFASNSSGPGALLATSLPVSDPVGGYSPVDSLWQIDRSGPSCRGAGIGYGVGSAGAGGVVPTLVTGGCPDLAQGFTVEMHGVAGGSVGVLGIGDGPVNLPALGGSLLVFPITGTMVVVANGANGAAGAGQVVLPVQITAPALVGLSFWFQAAFLDAAGAQGFALTNGLQLVIG